MWATTHNESHTFPCQKPCKSGHIWTQSNTSIIAMWRTHCAIYCLASLLSLLLLLLFSNDRVKILAKDCSFGFLSIDRFLCCVRARWWIHMTQFKIMFLIDSFNANNFCCNRTWRPRASAFAMSSFFLLGYELSKKKMKPRLSFFIDWNLHFLARSHAARATHARVHISSNCCSDVYFLSNSSFVNETREGSNSIDILNYEDELLFCLSIQNAIRILIRLEHFPHRWSTIRTLGGTGSFDFCKTIVSVFFSKVVRFLQEKKSELIIALLLLLFLLLFNAIRAEGT